MENNLEVIPIFFAADDGYMPFLAVALKSMIENASKKYYYSIKILYTNISEENKKKISKYESSNVKIEFVDLNYYIGKVGNKLYTRDYYTKTTYFRLFIPDLYPQYDKAIYLDSDIVVLGDISELFNIKLGTNLIGAVADDSVQNNVIFQEYVERVVGMSDYKKYFNAGILLMNLDELRKFKFQEKFMYLLETIKFSVAQDQDYLNRLCKGRTKIISTAWDRMPIPSDKIREDEIKIIHYNLMYKPWHFDGILYQEYFWKYAKKTEYINEINIIKKQYTEQDRFKDMEILNNLNKLCKKETDCVGNDKKVGLHKTYGAKLLLNVNSKEEEKEKYEERLKILEKIEKLEEEGIFDEDVENDPPSIPLTLDNVDYLNKKNSSKIKTKIANKIGEKFINELLKENKLIIKEVRGIENFENIDTGAIITCNHFNPFDSFAIEKIFRQTGKDKTKTLYKVIREGNYTSMPGLYGFFFRNCDTLPLSSNKSTMVEFMKAVETILKREDFILMYPEQSMWWNYKKPKPLKVGAFKFAAKNKVPVLPIFITMEDSNIMGEDGFQIQEYTVNIGKPIYPEENLSERENAEIMKDKNFEIWKNIYEEFYGIPLEYKKNQKVENC